MYRSHVTCSHVTCVHVSSHLTNGSHLLHYSPLQLLPPILLGSKGGIKAFQELCRAVRERAPPGPLLSSLAALRHRLPLPSPHLLPSLFLTQPPPSFQYRWATACGCFLFMRYTWWFVEFYIFMDSTLTCGCCSLHCMHTHALINPVMPWLSRQYICSMTAHLMTPF